MAFQKDMINDVDQNTVEGPQGAQYPIVQWHYPEPKMAKSGGLEGHGGWFISRENIPAELADELPAALLANGFSEDEMTLDNGNVIEGFYARDLSMALINNRKRWMADDDGRRVYGPWAWKTYETLVAEYGRAISQENFYVALKGLVEFGPFVVTVKGVSAMALAGTKKVPGVIPQFDATVIKAANDITKGKRWPRRAFWLTIGASRDKNGKPVYTEFGSGNSTSHLCLPMAVGLPKDAADVDLDQFAVERADFLKIQEMYDDSIDWASEWDDIEIGGDDDAAAKDEQPEMTADEVAEAAAEAGM